MLNNCHMYMVYLVFWGFLILFLRITRGDTRDCHGWYQRQVTIYPHRIMASFIITGVGKVKFHQGDKIHGLGRGFASRLKLTIPHEFAIKDFWHLYSYYSNNNISDFIIKSDEQITFQFSLNNLDYRWINFINFMPIYLTKFFCR